tara:strand:+ start:2808 stop:3158 length:351 start_codon:yes stop_codon:yes gene_type:complete
MGSGVGSEKIYQLIEECGGSERGSIVILQDLIKYLSRDTLEDFVEYFRRNYDMKLEEDTEELGFELETNNYELCSTCQNGKLIGAVCSDCLDRQIEELYLKEEGTTTFFSSKIPAC